MISMENKQRAEELRRLLEWEGFCRIQFYLQEQYGYEVNVFSQETDRKSISQEFRVFVEAWKNKQRYYTYANSLESPKEIVGRLKAPEQSEKSQDQEEKQIDPCMKGSPYLEEIQCVEGSLKRAEHAALENGAGVVNECACYHQRTETAIYRSAVV